jgi:hypothetical protein
MLNNSSLFTLREEWRSQKRMENGCTIKESAVKNIQIEFPQGWVTGRYEGCK